MSGLDDIFAEAGVTRHEQPVRVGRTEYTRGELVRPGETASEPTRAPVMPRELERGVPVVAHVRGLAVTGFASVEPDENPQAEREGLEIDDDALTTASDRPFGGDR
jgi:hypothetical protein